MIRVVIRTWEDLQERCTAEGILPQQMNNMKQAFAAGLYAASAAITIERAQARDISEDAFRIEMRP
jgi:hypothetical protein